MVTSDMAILRAGDATRTPNLQEFADSDLATDRA